MTLVVDASMIAASLIDGGPAGVWAEEKLLEENLVAPHVVFSEVAGVLRRAELEDRISAASATMAHADLVDLPIALLPYEPFAQRIWEFRATVTPYDAWYVAIAEFYDVPLATLDRKLTSAPGPTCSFHTR
jgi:predicted nucleic acid-binding protein